VRFQVLVLASLLATPACLPAGEPPTGQQIWAGRDRTLVGVLPVRSPDDGITRVLSFRQGTASNLGTELSLLSRAPSGAVADEVLQERWTCSGLPPCIGIDHQGGVYVSSLSPEPPLDFFANLTRIDLDTHQRVEFGVVAQYAFSASNRRVAVSLGRLGNAEQIVRVIEADGVSSLDLAPARAPTFVGEDLYFIGEGKILSRLGGGSTSPEVVRTGVDSFTVLWSTRGPRLLLHVPSIDGRTMGTAALLDPATGDERSLVLGWDTSLSWDGRWAVTRGPDLNSRRTFTLADLTTETDELFELPVDVNDAEWRPGHTEVWLRTTNWDGQATFIKEPGKPLREVPAIVAAYAAGENTTIFNRDGSRFYLVAPPDGATPPTVFAGDADDPSGTRLPLNPPGTRFSQHRELTDGRLVIEAFYVGGDRNDIYLVDPRDGATRLLGKDGGVVATGATRIIAMTHRVDQAGDLEVIQLDGGGAVPLAKEFARTPYLQPPLGDEDPTRPGTKIVYQFRARFPSPYDGFWLTDLP